MHSTLVHFGALVINTEIVTATCVVNKFLMFKHSHAHSYYSTNVRMYALHVTALLPLQRFFTSCKVINHK